LKLSSLLDRIASRPPTFTIYGRDGLPYMSRYRVVDIGKERGRIYLNHFHRGDEDAELHNHPWHGVSLSSWRADTARSAASGAPSWRASAGRGTST